MIWTNQARKKFRTCTIDSDTPDHSPNFALLFNCTHKLKLYLIALAQVTHIKSKLISNNSLEVGLMQKKNLASFCIVKVFQHTGSCPILLKMSYKALTHYRRNCKDISKKVGEKFAAYYKKNC